MDKEKKIKLLQNNIIQTQLSKKHFTYFIGLIESSCFEEHFLKSNLAGIRTKINENLSEYYRIRFVFIFGKDVSYFIPYLHMFNMFFHKT